MTAGDSSRRPSQAPPGSDTKTLQKYIGHSSAQYTNTNVIFVQALRAEYPSLHLSVVPTFEINLSTFAAAGNAGLAPIDKEQDRLSSLGYRAPARRLDGNQGVLAVSVSYGKFLLDWRGKEFVVYIISGSEGNADFGGFHNQYILSASVQATNDLLVECGSWSNALHNEVWVFDGGYWQKSKDLYEAVQKSSWDDVILPAEMKKAIISDVEIFFDGQDDYEKLRVPWKRGIIYYGPPGNGKTISIKAMMHQLYQRPDPIPTLYVKSLKSFSGGEYSINSIFTRARREAPCYLIFEDLDSIVTDDLRSYFLNAIDGIQRNDGILMVGSTNHLDRLDPGIAKRPSRFDRKYFFPNPNEEERAAYMRFWQDKLRGLDSVDFPDGICPAAAKITRGFSFAYLQEAMVASLLQIARRDKGGNDGDGDGDSDGSTAHPLCLECMKAHGRPAGGSTCDREPVRPFKGLFDLVWAVRRLEEDDKDLDQYILWRELKKQVRLLREQIQDDKDVRS